MRVLVCGSRTFADGDLLRQVLDGLYYRRTAEYCGDWTVLHAGTQGASKLARHWAQATGLVSENYPADERHGPDAGAIRDHQLLAEGKPDLLVAFMDKPLSASRPGPLVMLARQAGVRTVIVECWPPAADQTRMEL